MAAHLEQRGFAFRFFDAVDGRRMNIARHPGYDARRRRATHGRDLQPGELGCLLSHRGVYREILRQNLEYALVAEDDARFHPCARAVLQDLIGKYNRFDLVRLLDNPKVAASTRRRIIPLAGDFWLVRLRTAPGGAYATLISAQGAAKLVKATENFAFPIDTILGRTWETGLRAYAIQPGLAVHDFGFASAIGDQRFDKTIALTGPARVKFRINRLLFKLGEALGKSRAYYASAPGDFALRRRFAAARRPGGG